MKNPIIAELRRIRDTHAKRHNFNLDSMACELMDLEPWMEKRTYTLKGGKIVPLTSLRKRNVTKRMGGRSDRNAR
jgi:hypothetical protein